MQINSNTFKLGKEAQEGIESAIKKIAQENGIDNVEKVSIELSKEEAILTFKLAEEDSSDSEEKSDEEKSEESK